MDPYSLSTIVQLNNQHDLIREKYLNRKLLKYENIIVQIKIT